MKYLSTHAESERKLRKCKLTLNVAGSTKELTLYDWSTVQELKSEISKALGVEVGQQRVFYGNIELTDSKMIENYNLLQFPSCTKSLHVLFDHQLDIYTRACSICHSDVLPLVEQVQEGLVEGLNPKLTQDGTGGTYFMKNGRNEVTAVFKPTDEEPYAPSNPKSHIGKMGSISLRPGVLSGEAAYREVAAYLLDKGHFSSVPKTVLVESQHPAFYYPGPEVYPKTGSLQEFVKNVGTVDDFSTSIFSIQEIQKICILDMKILNMDRNEGNILVVKNQNGFGLVPIDHGLSIPDNFNISEYDLCWMSWPQTKEPITSECLEYIESIDPLSYIQFLKEVMPFRDICLRNIRIASLLMKKGAKAGLSLFNIGSMLYRKDFSDTPSTIEKVIDDSYDLYKTITKSLSHQLKIEKFLSENLKNPSKRRARAYSSNEIDVESFISASPSLESTTNTTSESFYCAVVAISEVSDDDFEESFEEDLFELNSDDLPSNPNLSFSSSSLPSLDDSPMRGVKSDDAFDTKLFYYIETFMDVAIQRMLKEQMKYSSPGGRTRSCSYFFKET
jgi:hypothetical protein